VEAFRTGGPLVLIDSLALAGSLLAAIAIGEWCGISLEPRSGFLTITVGCNLLVFLAFCGLYPGVATSPVVEFQRVSTATTLAFVSYSLAALGLDRDQPLLWPVVLLAWLLTLLSIMGGRFLVRSILCRFSWWGVQALVVGDRAAARSVYQALQSNPTQGLRPRLSLEGPEAALEHDDITDWSKGDTQSDRPGAEDVGSAPRIHCAVLATEKSSATDQARIIRKLCRRFRRVIVLVPETTESYGGLWMRTAQCGALPGWEVRDRLLSRPNRFLKRSLDLSLVTLASPALLLLVPIVGVLLKITSPGPVFFGHGRIGEKGRRFKAWKFRTMVTDADRRLERYLADNPQARDEWEQTKKLQNDPRVTKIGRWLRRTSLDELPQIWNVFLGQMSIVGPRPIITDEVAKYAAIFRLYTRVRPGITGLWQVSGRNDTTYAERVSLDSFYVRNWSVWFDLYILSKTIRAVVTGHGAS
jgi:Undecaprenyl-phosphate galactose phosphotransferase WbaP